MVLIFGQGSGGGGKVVTASSPIPMAVPAGSSKGHSKVTTIPQNSATKLNTGSMIIHSGSLDQSQIGSQTMGSNESGVSGVRHRKVASNRDQVWNLEIVVIQAVMSTFFENFNLPFTHIFFNRLRKRNSHRHKQFPLKSCHLIFFPWIIVVS